MSYSYRKGAEMEQAEVKFFLKKVVADTSGLAVTVMAALGDRLGLFKDLAANGPAVSSEFAKRTGINERYAKEWLAGMTSAGYLEYDPISQLFTLPPAHEPVLAQERGPFFLGGTHQMLLGMLKTLELLEKAFQTGNGIPMSADTVNKNMAASPPGLLMFMEAASVESAPFIQSIIDNSGHCRTKFG